jgi:hypothetical protein
MVYTQRLEHFANGVDQETEPDAAIPPKNGAHNCSLWDHSISKNGLIRVNWMLRS